MWPRKNYHTFSPHFNCKNFLDMIFIFMKDPFIPTQQQFLLDTWFLIIRSHLKKLENKIFLTLSWWHDLQLTNLCSSSNHIKERNNCHNKKLDHTIIGPTLVGKVTSFLESLATYIILGRLVCKECSTL